MRIDRPAEKFLDFGNLLSLMLLLLRVFYSPLVPSKMSCAVLLAHSLAKSGFFVEQLREFMSNFRTDSTPTLEWSENSLVLLALSDERLCWKGCNALAD